MAATEGGSELYRRYSGLQTESNIYTAALAAAQNPPDYAAEWDDEMSFDEWLGSGVPQNNWQDARLLFTSSEIPAWGGNSSNSHTIALPGAPARSLRRRVHYSDHARGDGDDHRRGWTLLAHELGHALLDYPLYNIDADLYNRSIDQTSGAITWLPAMGYLGSADLMGHDSRGPHLNGFFKLVLGWLDPLCFAPEDGTHSMRLDLPPVYGDPTNAILVQPDLYRHQDEQFLVEVRGDNGRDWEGNATQFDKSLPPDVNNSVFLYHINTQNPIGGRNVEDVRNAEPYIDLVGEPEGSSRVLGLRQGDRLELRQTRFYDGYDSGLELDVLDVENDGTHRLQLTWNLNPRLSVVTNSDGFTFLFGRDAQGEAVYKAFHAGNWSPSTEGWTGLGDGVEGRPVASNSGRAVEVFATRRALIPVSDSWGLSTLLTGRRVQRYDTGVGPFTRQIASPGMEPDGATWTALGGMAVNVGAMYSSYATTTSFVAVRDPSNKVLLKWRQSGEEWDPALRNWLDLGGDVRGNPAVTEDRAGRVHVFARSNTNRPLHKYRDQDGQWQPSADGWSELGGGIDADPVAVADRDDFKVHLFVRGISGRIFYKQWDRREWTTDAGTWTDLAGQVLGPPAVVQATDGSVHVFVTGVSRQVFHKRLEGDRWYPGEGEWNSLGGQALDSPTATELPGTHGIVKVYVTGISGRVFEKVWRDGEWTADWTNLGEPTP